MVIQHVCTRRGRGEYEYRGFAVYINPAYRPGYLGRWHVGLGQECHVEANLKACMHWIDQRMEQSDLFESEEMEVMP
ncbi:hypothetical protein [Chitinimonas koreensis]|uniref:hypothetical protein n=1 Tax=Chitinimonas koreensis TaxID=356302 RepID=UPI0012F8E973|nr:hypothetical protein [Chitinimonas koreensis]QNM95444.1 hypothetical protein H9L41_16445 [Chitinimonas koreensis]